MIYKKRWRGFTPIHLVFFSQKTIKNVLEKCGFNVIQLFSWGGISKGTVPQFVKKSFDCATKKLNIGDVMLVYAEKGEFIR